MTPFSGPTQRSWLSPATWCQKVPMSSANDSSVLPTTGGGGGGVAGGGRRRARAGGVVPEGAHVLGERLQRLADDEGGEGVYGGDAQLIAATDGKSESVAF